MLSRRGGTDGSLAAVPPPAACIRGGDPGGDDLLEAGEEDGAGAGREGGEGGAQRVVAALQAGAVGRVGGVEPAAVAEDPVASRAAA
jgi:hypothetical protein